MTDSTEAFFNRSIV